MKYKKIRRMLKASQKLSLHVKAKDSEINEVQISTSDTKEYDDYDIVPGSVSRDDHDMIHIDLQQGKKKKKKAKASNVFNDDDIASMQRALDSLKKERKAEKVEHDSHETNGNRNDNQRRPHNDNRRQGKPKDNILQKFANETMKEATRDKDTESVEEKVKNKLAE